LARRTTSKKGPSTTGPSTTGSDTAGSDPSNAPDPKAKDQPDRAKSTESTESGAKDAPKTAPTSSTTPDPKPKPGTRTAKSEASVATATESQLAKDISPPAPTDAPKAASPDADAGKESRGTDADTPEMVPMAGKTTPTEPDPGAAPSDKDAASARAEDILTSEGATDSAPPDTVVPTAPPPVAPERSGGLFPLLLGGVLAGGIGYAAAYFTAQQTPDTTELTQLQSEMANLRAEIEGVPPAADTQALEAEIAELRAQIAGLPAASEAEVSADIDAELAQLRAQLGEDTDLSALEARLDDLSTQAETVVGEVGSLRAAFGAADEQIAALTADMADLRDLAERRVAEAEAAVDTALAQSGLDSLRAALETGAPYADAVARLQEAGVSVSEDLAAPAASGIATLEELQDAYPEAARAALRAALQDAPTDSTADRLANFLRAQVGARSTVPREGDDPDAVLSRAGAAVEAGDLDGALTEIDALPDTAQAAMSDWLGAARARLAARNALPDLTNAITTE